MLLPITWVKNIDHILNTLFQIIGHGMICRCIKCTRSFVVISMMGLLEKITLMGERGIGKFDKLSVFNSQKEIEIISNRFKIPYI